MNKATAGTDSAAQVHKAGEMDHDRAMYKDAGEVVLKHKLPEVNNRTMDPVRIDEKVVVVDVLSQSCAQSPDRIVEKNWMFLCPTDNGRQFYSRVKNSAIARSVQCTGP